MYRPVTCASKKKPKKPASISTVCNGFWHFTAIYLFRSVQRSAAPAAAWTTTTWILSADCTSGMQQSTGMAA
jgi:hypothetical protein